MGLFDWPITKKTTQNMDNHKIEDYVAIFLGLPIELQGEIFEQRI